MNGLLFAQKFPFSDISREHLKKLNLSTDSLPEVAIKRAALMVSKAFSAGTYSPDADSLSREEIENEIIAFPIAKMFVSVMRTPNILEKFSLFVQRNTFNSLVGSNDSKDVCISLADDLKVPYSISEQKGFFAEVPLLNYLQSYFVDPENSLLSKPVEKGKVFLTVNDFARFLSEKAYAKVFDSLPISQKEVPKQIQELARSIDSQLVVIEKKNFDLKLLGKIDPSLFPPCMSALYAEQLAGKKLQYMARLALASFLFQLGMSKTEMLSLLSKSPDYKKNIAEYHVKRIFDKGLSAPGCEKIKEYGLRVAECNKVCTYKHPVQYYLSHLGMKNRMKNNSKQKSAGAEEISEVKK